MSDPVTGVAGGIGVAKLASVGAAAVGAAVMAASKPPEDRKQLFRYAVVAIGSGFLFADVAAEFAGRYFGMEPGKLTLPCGGLIGAVSWAAWGYVTHLIAKVQASDDGLIPALKKAIFGG